MEWPTIDAASITSNYSSVEDDDEDDVEKEKELISTLTKKIVTKEIYSRAALASVSDITIDHKTSGFEDRVDSFLRFLVSGDEDDEDGASWETTERHRSVVRSFVELMTFPKNNRERTLEMCQGGLDAVHDIMKYRFPKEHQETNNSSNNHRPPTVLSARDAFVMCRSFPCLETEKITGTLPSSSSIDFRFGLVTATQKNNKRNATNDNDKNNNDPDHCDASFSCGEEDASSFLFGIDACDVVTKLRKNGQMETSAASLAKHTLTCSPGAIVSAVKHKIFVVLGCDHPLAPTKSLLRIPGATVLGVPTCRKSGLHRILNHVRYNSPKDAEFLYPVMIGGGGDDNNDDNNNDDENMIVSRGPQIARWILDNTEKIMEERRKRTRIVMAAATSSSSNDEDDEDTEIVLVPMPLPTAAVGREGDGRRRFYNDDLAVPYEVSSDLIVQRVLTARRGNDNDSGEAVKCSVWSYQNSSTCMVVPPASTTNSTERLRRRPSHEPWMHTFSGGTMLTPVDNDNVNVVDNCNSSSSNSSSSINHDYSIVNGIISSKGPYRVLAEMIRTWRCLLMNHRPRFVDYDDDDDDNEDGYKGSSSSSNNNNYVYVFAPYVPLLRSDTFLLPVRNDDGEGNNNNNDETEKEDEKKKKKKNDSTTATTVAASSTATNINNNFITDPLRVFDEEFASSLMAAISIAGLTDPLVNRPMPTMDDDNEEGRGGASTLFSMFWFGSVHGGIWNCPYTLDSVNGYGGYLLQKMYDLRIGDYYKMAADYFYYYYPSSSASDDEDHRSSSRRNEDDDDDNDNNDVSSDATNTHHATDDEPPPFPHLLAP